MKTLRLLSLFLVSLLAWSCQPEEDQIIEEESLLLRMPFNEQVFFLDKQDGYSHVYKVEYDFQGLQGDAVLTPFVKVPGGSHMTVSPQIEETDTRYLTIVNNGNPGKVHFVNVNDASDHRVVDLYRWTGDGAEVDAVDDNRVKITQVDYDQNNFLFIAGKDGFFRVTANYSDMNPNVWAEGLEDDGGIGGGVGGGVGGGPGGGIGGGIGGGVGGPGTPVDPGDGPEDEDRIWAVKLSNNGGITMEEEDSEDYFDESERSLKKPKFRGGDILFTQNNEETGGFEKERLISVTQAHGNAAILVNLEFGADSKAVNFNASKLFNLMKVRKVGRERGVGKVTGAALIGDNHLMTSHHFTTVFEIRSLTGELLASPNIVMDEGVDLSGWSYREKNGYIKHNWGDMASIQTFDSEFTAVSRSIPEDVSQGYYPLDDDAVLAEVELYRPGSVVLNNYDVDDDNPAISKEARRNSSNSDIADLRDKPYKFTSLGKENGTMILKFDERITVNEATRLQVVETSWNKLPSYADTQAAYNAYPEKASVYVSNYGGRYIGDWINDNSNWTKVGDAYISSNEYRLTGVVNSFKWIRLVDDGSTSPDGFDVNFVAAYELCQVEDYCLDYDGELAANKPVRADFINTVVYGANSYFKIRVRNTTEDAANYEINFTSFQSSYNAVSGTVAGKSECFIHVPVVFDTDNPTFVLDVNGESVSGTGTASVTEENTEIVCVPNSNPQG